MICCGWFVFFFYGSWFAFDLFFEFVIDAMPQKKKKKDIVGQREAFLDCFLIGPQIGPKFDLARWGSWGPRSPMGWVWALGKKPV